MQRVHITAMSSILLLCLAAVTGVFAQGDVDAGAKAYETLKCAKCHGDDGKGAGPTVKKLIEKGKDIEMHDWTDKAFMSEKVSKKGGLGGPVALASGYENTYPLPNRPE
ncbi:hypothetical protein C2W62_10325 [Candidatus Entotheonella serta]|nr:hypothetical protein C2W62_10325 [Candidatus Entotheonella serta]